MTFVFHLLTTPRSTEEYICLVLGPFVYSALRKALGDVRGDTAHIWISVYPFKSIKRMREVLKDKICSQHTIWMRGESRGQEGWCFRAQASVQINSKVSFCFVCLVSQERRNVCACVWCA